MTVGSYLVRIEGGLVKDLKTIDAEALAAAKTAAAYVDGVIVNDIEPPLANFFQNVIPNTIAAVKPFAQEALQEIGADLPLLLTDLATQGISGLASFFAAVAPALALTAEKAVAAGVQADENSALVAVGAVVADVKATLASTAASLAPTPTT